MGMSERVKKAFKAMKSIGISEDKTKPALKKLLKVFNKNWSLIEEENYRVLADAIFEYEETEGYEIQTEEVRRVIIQQLCLVQKIKSGSENRTMIQTIIEGKIVPSEVTVGLLERTVTKDPGQEPFSFNIGLNKVIKGWDEGVLGMQVGEVARLTVSEI